MLRLLLLTEGNTSAMPTLTEITPFLGSAGSLGFAIWFAWYTATTLIPNQNKEHREAFDKLNTTHAETIKGLVGEMKEQRETFERMKGVRH